jgi:4-hydroxy-3-methylbut-2-enyl diphosphate reductase IspH
MGIFSTVRDTIVAVCQPVISTAQAADESLSIATEYIHNRAVSTKLTDKQSVMVSTAETMNELQAKLDADEGLKAQYEALEKHFA